MLHRRVKDQYNLESEIHSIAYYKPAEKIIAGTEQLNVTLTPLLYSPTNIAYLDCGSVRREEGRGNRRLKRSYRLDKVSTH